jgi:hypothetical protein
VHGGNEPIPPSRNGLNESWILGDVAQGAAELRDGNIHGLIEVPITGLRPDTFVQLLAGDKFARSFQQGQQDLERLLLHLDPDAGLAKFAFFKVDFVHAELYGCVPGRPHGLGVYHLSPFFEEMSSSIH